MKSVRMDHFIWQWTVDSKNKGTFYPTSINGFVQLKTSDIVDISLEQASGFPRCGMQLTRQDFKRLSGLTAKYSQPAIHQLPCPE